MFSLDNIILSLTFKNKLSFLTEYGISFGTVFHNTNGGRWTIVVLFFTFICILIFKNSVEKLVSFKLNYKTALLSGFYFVGSLLLLNRVSEFLYFNLHHPPEIAFLQG